MNMSGERSVKIIGLSVIVISCIVCYLTYRLQDTTTRYGFTTLVTENRKTFTVSLGSTDIHMCPFNIRNEHLKSLCMKFPELPLNNRDKVLQTVYFDHDMKYLGCVIGKTGSTTIREFMLNSKDTNSTNLGQIFDYEFLVSLNLVVTRNVPMHEVIQNYSNYRKFITVRHPLQRLVSAYYQLRYKHNETLSTCIKHLPEMLLKDRHWNDYRHLCHPCDVKYDFILKTETRQEDFAELSTEIGLNPLIKPGFHNVNNREKTFHTKPEANYTYKYDSLIVHEQISHPKDFKRMMKIFSIDLELFGYGWNETSGKSSCSVFNYNTNTFCC